MCSLSVFALAVVTSFVMPESVVSCCFDVLTIWRVQPHQRGNIIFLFHSRVTFSFLERVLIMARKGECVFPR